MILETRTLSLAYDQANVITELDLTVPEGAITALLGPNGCGKSTLLRGLARLMRPQSGQVVLDGQDMQKAPTREIARKLGILPQNPRAPEGLTVYELISQGRYPHQGLFQQWSSEDEDAVRRALEMTQLGDLSLRTIETLSGGQKQRAWIAMALAQDTGLLLLDEPTTYLDLLHQVEVLDLLHRLNREGGRTVVMALHDLNHAAQYADHCVLLAEGGIMAAGAPHEVITPENLRAVYGVECLVIPHPEFGTPLCLPLGKVG